MRAKAATAFLSLVIAADAGRADAACDLIAALDVAFPSSLGEISSPFGQAGQEVTIRRDTAAFSAAPAGNSISLEFRPVGGPVTILPVVALPPQDGSGCPSSECQGGMCSCVRFSFPDTDGEIGAPADGRGLTGPVQIVVTTSAVETARIDALRIPGTSFTDGVFPSFVALPPSNPFVGLDQGPGGDVLGAVDDAGTAFIPFDFVGLVQPEQLQTRFVDVVAPAGVPLSSLDLSAFTRDGRRLPPLLQVLSSGAILGTVDAPSSVLRVTGLPPGPLLTPQEGRGPIVIPGVAGVSDPHKRGDAITLRTNGRWAVFENRECGAQDPPPDCTDLNQDGDQSDYFLLALDLETEGAEPAVVDSFDAADFAGYPAGFGFGPAYRFVTSGELVVFEMSEGRAYDFNGDGDGVDILRSGAFDLTRGTRIELADDSNRLEIDGSLLAFAVTVDAPWGKDALYFYDTSLADPGPHVVSDGLHPEFYLLPLDPGLEPLLVSRISPLNTYRFDVGGGRIAFVVAEAFHGADLDGSGDAEGFVVMIRGTGGSIEVVGDIAPSIGNLRLNARWLAFNFFTGFDTYVVVFDAADPTNQIGTVCDDFGYTGSLFGEPSEDVLPCVLAERSNLGETLDRNEDGDFDDWVLRTFIPGPNLGTDRNLGLAANGTCISQPAQPPCPEEDIIHRPITRGSLLAVGVDEVAQGADLDGDGALGGPSVFPVQPTVLHVYDSRLDRVRIVPQKVAATADQLLHFFDDGISLVTPDVRRRLLRDLDRDGQLEESVVEPSSGDVAIMDNCPLIANPAQEDRDGDGIGDACDTFRCGTAPDPGCVRPLVGLRTSVKLARGPIPLRDQLTWKWSDGPFIDSADVGNPVPPGGDDYRLCVFDGSGPILDLPIPAGGVCGTKPCWKINPSGTKVQFRSKASGIQSIDIIRGAPGKSKIQVKGRGEGLDLPGLPIGESPLTVQLGNERGSCWEAVFSFPPVSKNDLRQFSDKAD